MGKHQAQQSLWAGKALGAAVIAGGMLLAGPAGIALADGPGGGGTGAPGGPDGTPGPGGPGGPGTPPPSAGTALQHAVTTYQTQLNTALGGLTTRRPTPAQIRTSIGQVQAANQQFRSAVTTIVTRH